LKIGPGEQILIKYSSYSIKPLSCAMLVNPKKFYELKIGFLIAFSIALDSLMMA
jgi:hypothetical protein